MGKDFEQFRSRDKLSTRPTKRWEKTFATLLRRARRSIAADGKYAAGDSDCFRRGVARAGEKGIKPGFVAGHSLGEYSAHVAAGTISFAEAVRTVRNRGKYMQEAVPVGTGAMAAILA